MHICVSLQKERKETLDSLIGYNKRLFRQVSAEGFAVFDCDG